MAEKKWIQKATKKMKAKGTVGSLRKALGVKKGEKIPLKKLQAAKKNPRLAKKANFALNVRKK